MTAQVSMSGGPVGRDGRPGMLAQVVEEMEEEDFEPSLDPIATAALARAITDSEDEGTGGSPSIPNLSKEPSIDNSDDGKNVGAPTVGACFSLLVLLWNVSSFMPTESNSGLALDAWWFLLLLCVVWGGRGYSIFKHFCWGGEWIQYI